MELLTLKIKYSDFKQITRSKTVLNWISSAEEFKIIIDELLEEFKSENFSVRLLGLSLSNLNNQPLTYGLQLTFEF